MKALRRLFIDSLLLIAVLVFATPIYAQKNILVASTDNPKGSLHVLALDKFSELLSLYSNNELAAQVHYRGSEHYPAIRGEELSMSFVMSGKRDKFTGKTIDITVIASGNASLKAPVLEFLMFPYLFNSTNSAKKLFRNREFMNEVNAVLSERHNVRALGWLIGGYRHLTNSVKPVKRLSDIKNMKVRTPRNRIMRDTYKAFGADVVTLDWSKTFDALDTGRVDGQENPYNVIYYSKFWDAGQKYLTDNGPFLWVGPILINNSYYQSLPDKHKKALDRAALEAAEYEWTWIEQQNLDFRNKLEKQGIEISELVDKREWVYVSRLLWTSYYKYIGYGNYEEGENMVIKVMSIIERDDW